MRKHFRVLICAVCLIICLGMLAGCRGRSSEQQSDSWRRQGRKRLGIRLKLKLILWTVMMKI